VTQPQKKQDPRVAQTAAAALGAAAITQNTAAATTAVIQMLWRGINPYDHGEVSGFAAQAGRIMVSSQRTVANAHVAAQQLQLKAVGINQPVTVTIPDNVRGSTVTLGGGEPKVHQTEATVDYGDGEQTIPKGDAARARCLSGQPKPTGTNGLSAPTTKPRMIKLSNGFQHC
jgi:hypothetical protein